MQQLVFYNHVCWKCCVRYHVNTVKKMRTNEVEVSTCRDCAEKEEQQKALQMSKRTKMVNVVMRNGKQQIIIQHV